MTEKRLREQGHVGARLAADHARALIDAIPIPAAIVSDLERAEWTVYANAVPLTRFTSPPATDGSMGIEHLLARRGAMPKRVPEAIIEAWKSGRTVSTAVAVRPIPPCSLWVSPVSFSELAGVLALATPLPVVPESEVLNDVAHELRTPLSVISGYISMLADGSFGPTPMAWRGAIDLLSLKVREVAGMVDRLLESSRLQAGMSTIGRERVDLGAVLRQAVNRARPRVELVNGHVELAIGDRPIWCGGDARVIGAVIDNLINNALSYSTGEPWVKVSAVDGEVVSVRVEDHGVGISPDQIEAIFQRFARVDNPAIGFPAGTGLGLYIARSNAESMGGALVVEASELGVGTTFRLDLPSAN